MKVLRWFMVFVICALATMTLTGVAKPAFAQGPSVYTLGHEESIQPVSGDVHKFIAQTSGSYWTDFPDYPGGKKVGMVKIYVRLDGVLVGGTSVYVSKSPTSPTVIPLVVNGVMGSGTHTVTLGITGWDEDADIVDFTEISSVFVVP